jgi:hypothetical protein
MIKVQVFTALFLFLRLVCSGATTANNQKVVPIWNTPFLPPVFDTAK